MKFTDLGLIEPIVRAVADKGYTDATPIQANAIPAALEGRDILGTAQTGTGKTCAFALPVLQSLVEHDNHKAKRNRGKGRRPRALVLAPTRELAAQIFDSFVAYGRHVKHIRHAVIFGGVNQRKQVAALREGVDVLVATPGRLHDLIEQGHADLGEIELLVLDEADRMLDMGFIHDIRKVVRMVPEDRQTLFFSATVSREIKALASGLLTDPVLVETAPESTTVDAIAQRLYPVVKEDKAELLSRILGAKDVTRALVFSRTKHGADRIAKNLRRQNIEAEAIHGNKTQNNRTKALKKFKSGAVRVLVATDIASRGIDVTEITHVINYDMPVDPETYVHRIGRTARAGTTGIAISFCDRDETDKWFAIEKRSKLQIPLGDDHTDLTYDAPPRPSRDDRRGPRRAGGKGGRRPSRGSARGPRPESAEQAPRPKKPRSKNAKRAARQAGASAAGAKPNSKSSSPRAAGNKPAGPKRKKKPVRAGGAGPAGKPKPNAKRRRASSPTG